MPLIKLKHSLLAGFQIGVALALFHCHCQFSSGSRRSPARTAARCNQARTLCRWLSPVLRFCTVISSIRLNSPGGHPFSDRAHDCQLSDQLSRSSQFAQSIDLQLAPSAATLAPIIFVFVVMLLLVFVVASLRLHKRCLDLQFVHLIEFLLRLLPCCCASFCCCCCFTTSLG